MFNKVIVAEDLDSINIAVVQALEELTIPKIQFTKYCDDAYLKIKKAQLDYQPFELLITDLSFKADHRENDLSSGEQLIMAVKKIQPEIKIIVFSIEDKSYRIKSLFDDLGINGFVAKGRHSIPELKKAIQSVYNTEEKFLSATLSHVLQDKTLHEIETYDLSLLKLLSQGITQEEIGIQFQKQGITPFGSSSIEKRINKLKIYFKANNNVHLIAIAKDLGLV
jgi:two-component system, NarL family, captular synthesis response regulator RcsB